MPFKIGDLVTKIEMNRNWVTYRLLAENTVYLSSINFSLVSKNFSSKVIKPVFQCVIIVQLQLRDRDVLTWGTPNCHVQVLFGQVKTPQDNKCFMSIQCLLGC